MSATKDRQRVGEDRRARVAGARRVRPPGA